MAHLAELRLDRAPRGVILMSAKYIFRESARDQRWLRARVSEINVVITARQEMQPLRGEKCDEWSWLALTFG
jgi:hypothetical protein